MSRARRALRAMGAYAIRVGQLLSQSVGLALSIAGSALRPRTWRRTVREEFVAQLYLTGVRAFASTLVVGAVVGLGIVFQALYWLESAGQLGLAGPFLVLGLVRDTAPFLVGLIIIGRSGSLMAVELMSMRSEGQLHMLSSLGIDPVELIVVPRVIALSVSAFCLTVCFIAAALSAGYFAGTLAGVTDRSLMDFFNQVLGGMSAKVYALVLVKPLAVGFVIGIISTLTSLGQLEAHYAFDRVLPLGFMRSLLAVLVLSAVLDVLL